MFEYSKKQAQVEIILFYEASTIFLENYSDYNNVFSAKNTVRLSKHTKINNYAIILK